VYNPKEDVLLFFKFYDPKTSTLKNVCHLCFPTSTTLKDVENTIDKLEKLYKNKQYTHKRIWQVGMIMKVRLEVLKSKKPNQYALANKYFKFLGKRTKLNEKNRYNISFK
jgi:hypothetical protein